MNKNRIPWGLFPVRRLYETTPAASEGRGKWTQLLCLEAQNRLPAEAYRAFVNGAPN